MNSGKNPDKEIDELLASAPAVPKHKPVIHPKRRKDFQAGNRSYTTGRNGLNLRAIKAVEEKLEWCVAWTNECKNVSKQMRSFNNEVRRSKGKKANSSSFLHSVANAICHALSSLLDAIFPHKPSLADEKAVSEAKKMVMQSRTGSSSSSRQPTLRR